MSWSIVEKAMIFFEFISQRADCTYIFNLIYVSIFMNRYHADKKRPAQIGCYFEVPGYFSAIMMLFAGAIFAILTKFAGGRWLLENYPGIFSLGNVSKNGPSKEMADNTNFELVLNGLGK